jgi:hypothetical protein
MLIYYRKKEKYSMKIGRINTQVFSPPHVLSAFLALRTKNRAFRSKSSDLPMQILWAFRYNPLRPTGFPPPTAV